MLIFLWAIGSGNLNQSTIPVTQIIQIDWYTFKKINR